MIGVANFLFVPIAIIWGRRPLFIAGGLMFVFSCLECTRSNDHFAHFISRIFLGLGVGAAETLVLMVVADISFVHQRERYIAAYSVLQQAITAALGIASTYMAIYQSWQTYYYVYMALGILGVSLTVLFLRETRFDRPAAYIDGQRIVFDAFGNLRTVEATEEDTNQAAEHTHGLSTGAEEVKLSLWQKYTPFPPLIGNPAKVFASYWVDTVLALVDLAILWAIGLQTLLLACIIVQSLSLPVLVEGAYHWTPQNVGLVAVASVIGPALAIPYAALADKATVYYLAKRHHGRHRPEDRFSMMGPLLLLAILFTLLYGHLAASAPNGTWASLLVAYGGSYLVFVAVTVSTISFVVEHVSHNPGPALVLVLGGKNILSYPTSNALAPLVTTGRYVYVHSILGGLVTGWTLLAVPLYFGLPYLRALKPRKASSA